ncbi:stage II sporulation protein SpoIIB [Barrientosiimonas marina]|uniref:SPOR domain-containing protein n=1 Tax=Lentibacillus kimchii TaxID=1542911 RepID=A0ABW2UZF7_9BACI
MRKTNKVDIWINGKKIKQTQNDKAPTKKRDQKDSSDEHAAAVDDTEIVKTTEQDQTSRHTGSAFTRNSKVKDLKPFFLAAFSAIVIGSLLGFFLLNMFVDINADMNGHESNRPSAAGADEKGDGTAQADSEGQGTTGSSVQPESAFVLQAGKFSDQSNARSKADAYRAAGYPGVVWEKDGFFFVLSGIAGSAQKTEKMASELDDNDMTVYVKKWKTASVEKELAQSDKKWLQTFTEQWQASLKQVSAGESISKKAWSEVVNAVPADTDQLSELTASLTDQQPRMGEGDEWHDQQILLSLWQKGNQILH